MTACPLPPAPRLGTGGAADAPAGVTAVFHHLLDQAAAGQPTTIGFPGAVDIDYSPALPLFSRLWNNVGDPATPPGGSAHTKTLEQAVITWCADLLGLEENDRWGYVTAGGTEGNLAALHAAHHRFPDAVVYFSQASHYSINKIIDIIGVDARLVRTDERGEMDYHHLSVLARHHAARPAIVVANVGTTMTEAIDDPRCIDVALGPFAAQRRHIHADAALSGVPLALDGVLQFARLGGAGVDSVAFSGHKFFGTPIPCGVVLMRDSARKQGRHVAYTATLDTTVSGSRCGQAAALLWYAIAAYGHEGHRRRVRQSRELADYTVARLTAAGWPAWRHHHAFTVVLRTPPAEVLRKWLLATDGDWSHIVCMPGITHDQIDGFVADLAGAGPRMGSTHKPPA